MKRIRLLTTLTANRRGEFAFGIPRAGWWGFCALGVGPAKEYKGKELSQDAVIWIQARDMK
jgi:cobalt/nickel transport protein